ncbi:hypothetical protein V8C34DRAFT_298174 [Trichoderma compactum]
MFFFYFFNFDFLGILVIFVLFLLSADPPLAATIIYCFHPSLNHIFFYSSRLWRKFYVETNYNL